MDEGDLIHRIFYQIGHIEETQPVFQESENSYFIGCIQHAGKVPAPVQGIGGQRKVTECFDIGFLEGQVSGFPEIIAGEIVRYPLRECHGILMGSFISGKPICALMLPSSNITML